MKRRESGRRCGSPDMAMRLRHAHRVVETSRHPIVLARADGAFAEALKVERMYALPPGEIEAALAGDALARLRMDIRLVQRDRRLGWDTKLTVAGAFCPSYVASLLALFS